MLKHRQIKESITEIKVIDFIFGNTYLLLYLKFKNKKSIFKYLIKKTDKNIIKGPQSIIWTQSGGEYLISTKIALKIIKIFKKNIEKKLGPSPISWFDNFKPQLHFSFILRKFWNIDCLPHCGQQEFWRTYISEGFFSTKLNYYFLKSSSNLHLIEKKYMIKQDYLNV